MAPTCHQCYLRKVKCDKQQPCSECSRRGEVCEPAKYGVRAAGGQHAGAPPAKRRRMQGSAEVADRIAVYETALRSYGVDPESLLLESRKSVPSSPPPGGKVPPQRQSPQPAPPPIDDTHEEVQDIQQVLFPRQKEESAMSFSRWFDAVFLDDGASLLLPDATEPAADCTHPNPFQTFRLVQLYKERIYPLSALVDLAGIDEIVYRLGEGILTHSENALVFAVYTAALRVLTPQECQSMFHADQHRLVTRFRLAAKHYIHAGQGVWRTSDFRIFQAYTVLLAGYHQRIDPRTLVSLTSSAIRIAMRLGLHREKAHLSPAETQLRRSIWWELQAMDRRALHKTGVGCMAAHLYVPVPLPSAVPVAVIIRSEVNRFLGVLRSEQGADVGWNEFSIPQWPLQEKLARIGRFEEALRRRWLDAITPDSPAPARLARCWALMQLQVFRLECYVAAESLQARGRQSGASGLDLGALRTATLEISCSVLHLAAEIDAGTDFMPFVWFAMNNKPFTVLAHLLRLLRIHTNGTVVEQCWTALKDHSWILRGPPRIIDGEVHLPRGPSLLAHALVEAWNAYVAANGGGVEEPGYVQEAKSVMFRPNEGAAVNGAAAATAAVPEATSTQQQAPTEPSDSSQLDIDWEEWFQSSVFGTEFQGVDLRLR